MANGELMVVAGEASGDLHAADVLAELRRRRPELRAFGMGGARLEAAGLERLFDAREISVMGIAEVLPRLPRIWRVFRALVRAADADLAPVSPERIAALNEQGTAFYQAAYRGS